MLKEYQTSETNFVNSFVVNSLNNLPVSAGNIIIDLEYFSELEKSVKVDFSAVFDQNFDITQAEESDVAALLTDEKVRQILKVSEDEF
jgi:hypothetical protein